MEHEPPEKNNYTYLNAHVPNNILRKEFAMCQLKNLSTCNYSFAIRLRHHCSFIYFYFFWARFKYDSISYSFNR